MKLDIHKSVAFIDFQLDAQNSYLFIYNTFIKFIRNNQQDATL